MIRRVSSIVIRWLTIFLPKNLKYIQSQKEIKPKTYQLNPEQALFCQVVRARSTLWQVTSRSFTAYFDNELKLPRTKKLEGAGDFMTSMSAVS